MRLGCRPVLVHFFYPFCPYMFYVFTRKMYSVFYMDPSSYLFLRHLPLLLSDSEDDFLCRHISTIGYEICRRGHDKFSLSSCTQTSTACFFIYLGVLTFHQQASVLVLMFFFDSLLCCCLSILVCPSLNLNKANKDKLQENKKQT